MKKALTVTVLANMTSNYSDVLGNISSVQKVFKNQKVYAMRSKESLKNAICVQAGLYDDLKTELDGAMQKLANQEVNAATCKALEGGYMSTKGTTHVRNSSFYLTDAISCENFINETRFHNNLYLASTHAKANALNVQNDSKAVGLMLYQYEYDKSLKTYSMTIDLEMVGKDETFNAEANAQEKVSRVNALLDTIENLSLIVKGNLDNAEPIFIVGGLSERKTHYFENVVNVKGRKLIISEDLKDKLANGFNAGLLESGVLENENDIKKELKPLSITKFFEILKQDVKEYYGV